MIGLFDADVAEFGLLPFNLELMKLASYYKSQKRETHFLETFTPKKYDLVYLRRDFLDKIDLTKYLQEKKVVAGGYYFTGGLYVPFDEEIENSIPDKTIYMRFANERNLWRHQAFSYSMESEHLRLSLDNKTINPNYKNFLENEAEVKRVLFHDYNINQVSGSFEEISNFSRIYGDKTKQKVSIGFKYPIQVDTVEDLMKWTSPDFIVNLYSIQINGIMSDELVDNIINQKRRKGIISTILYVVTDPAISEDIFMKEVAPLVFLQVGTFAHAGIRVKLSFHKNYFSDSRYERLLDLFSYYGKSILTLYALGRNSQLATDNLISFVKKLDNKPNPMFPTGLSKEEVRELFKLVQEKNKDLLQLFYKPVEFTNKPIHLSSRAITRLKANQERLRRLRQNKKEEESD